MTTSTAITTNGAGLTETWATAAQIAAASGASEWATVRKLRQLAIDGRVDRKVSGSGVERWRLTRTTTSEPPTQEPQQMSDISRRDTTNSDRPKNEPRPASVCASATRMQPPAAQRVFDALEESPVSTGTIARLAGVSLREAGLVLVALQERELALRVGMRGAAEDAKVRAPTRPALPTAGEEWRLSQAASRIVRRRR